MIITDEMLRLAIELARPSAEAILNAVGTTWGPKWVEGTILAPGVSKAIPYCFGKKTAWDPKWGPKRKPFSSIAKRKSQPAVRLGVNTSTIVALCPWLLRDGEYLYAGGASRFGITVTSSGAKGRTDEAIAEILISTIILLAYLDADQRAAQKRMQID